MAISFTGKNRVIVRIYSIVLKIVRLLYKKPKIRGLENVRDGVPRVFVANHLESYSPVVLMTYLPFLLYPWVTHEIMDYSKCAAYIEEDFLRKELHLLPPLSTILAKLIGRICVSLMRYLNAVPVFKMDKRAAKSIEISVEYLRSGRDILVFPEMQDVELNRHIRKFDTGFVRMGKRYSERNTGAVDFYPVAVDKQERVVTIGRPESYDAARRFHPEKRRITKALEKRICEML